MRQDLIGNALRVEKNVKKIKKIHLQVQEEPKKSQVKYKARHDQHWIQKSFREGDTYSYN